jgi:hypothetical protein
MEIFSRSFQPRFHIPNWTLPDAPEERLVGDMLGSILRNNKLWNEHLLPQHYFLLDKGLGGPKKGKPAALPMDFIADAASLHTDLSAIFQSTGIGADASALLHHEGGPGEMTSRLDRRRVRAGPAEVRVICELYYEDFMAFGYALPEPCRGA